MDERDLRLLVTLATEGVQEYSCEKVTEQTYLYYLFNKRVQSAYACFGCVMLMWMFIYIFLVEIALPPSLVRMLMALAFTEFFW